MDPLILRLAYTVSITALQSPKEHNHEVREFPSCNASLPTHGYPSNPCLTSFAVKHSLSWFRHLGRPPSYCLGLGLAVLPSLAHSGHYS